ncbi:MAG: response regulator transcription factor [Burkholderiaceae bacterium]
MVDASIIQEHRPIYRIATAGLDPRDVRLIEIVFKHSEYNRFEFLLDDGSDPRSIDVLLVNTATPEGLQAVSAVRRQPRQIPVIAAVPRGVPSPARHAISIDRLTLQLLPILNKVVESELLSPETQPMTVPLPQDGPRLAEHWPPPVGRPAMPGFAVPDGSVAPGRVPATNAAPTGTATVVRPPAAVPAPNPAEPRAAASPAAVPARRAGDSGSRPVHAAAAGEAAAPGTVTARAPATQVGSAGAAPATQRLAAATAAGSAPDAGAPLPAGRRPRILVVDDSPTVRQQLGLALTRMGFVCEMVARGEQALERLAASRYDLVMADVMIPDMDGYRLTKAIRKQHRGVPVLILSSRGSAFDHARGMLAGCRAYLVKPVPLRELDAAILKVLKKSMPAAELEPLLRNAAAARTAAARLAAARAQPARAPGSAGVPGSADARA